MHEVIAMSDAGATAPTLPAAMADITAQGMSEHELERARQASRRQVRAELVTLLPNLRAFARSLCNNATEADDLVQEGLTKALASIDRFMPGSNLRAWVFTIIRNTCYSNLRKRRHEVADVDGIHAARLESKPNQDSHLDLMDFKAAFGTLSRDHRVALTLIGAEGMSYEEAAAVCGCAVGTMKSRVNRARQQLADKLNLKVEALAPLGGRASAAAPSSEP
jgi:RNA polymerase sigma-70 factor (ECF subfamily)